MKKGQRILVKLLILAILVSMTALGQPLKVNASTLPGSFAKGADVSWLPQLEALGYKFYNEQGAEQDLLQILKDYGIDSIRLRAFVNPSDDPSNGHNSTEELVQLASRVSALGFRVMIDLHYSDSWADPGKQVTPAAWANDNLEQLKVHVSEYTSEVMNALKTAGVTPEWVQIGNEINNGMMHPLGSYSNTENLVQLIQAGSSAARAVFPATKIIIHRANGADNGVVSFYDGLVAAGLKDTDYDIIGLSYYPESVFTSSIDELSANMNTLAAKFGKEVMIVEVGGNVSTNADNVYNMLVAVQNHSKAVPDGQGTGVFYWAPEGVYFGYPLSAWNPDGTPSFAMNAFKDGAAEINRYPVESLTLDKHTASIEEGGTGSIKAVISPDNATYKGVTFTSSNPEVVKVDRYKGTISGLAAGTATVTAVTYDGGFTDAAEITVVAGTSLIQNPGFEDGLNNWTVTGDAGAVSTDSDKHSGSAALHYWSAGAGEFQVSQTITGLENGTYQLSAWVSGGGEEETAEIFAGDQKQSFKNTGWQIWSNPAIDHIEVTDGILSIGAKLKYSGGQWGNIDDFKLVKQAGAIQTSNLTVNGKLADWYLEGNKPSTFGDSNASGGFDYGDDKPIDFTITHEITGLEPGTYTLNAKVFGDKGEPDPGSVMYIVSEGQTYSVPITYSGSAWLNPRTLTLKYVHVGDDGIAQVGFTVKTNSDNHYGYLDEVTFVRNPDSSPEIPSEPTPDPGEAPAETPVESPAASPTASPSPSPTADSSSVWSAPQAALKPTPQPAAQPDVKVLTTPEANAENKIVISAQDGVKEVRLPANAAAINGTNRLRVEAKDAVIEIPGKVLKELQVLAGENAEDKMISLEWASLSAEDKSALLQLADNKSDAELKLAGDVYSFNLSIVNPDGTKTPMTHFTEPVTLRLKVQAGANVQLLGVYNIADEGTLEYVGGTMDQGVMLAQVNHFSKYAVLEYNKTFADVASDHWAYNVIKEAAAKHIIAGISESSFAPKQEVTRAEFVSMLVRALGVKNANASPFNDVEHTKWYAGGIAAAYEAGLVKGYAAGRFEPEAHITRQEMAVMLMRAYEIRTGNVTPLVSLAKFSDSDKIDNWAVNAVSAAQSLGFINGNADGFYLPQSFTNRAESAKAVSLLLAK
ncbi:glycosyl hydrolase 53 family protein [Paenibacillus sp. MMS20-IR301]|uniref:glycosyl hydrolase 53 family protein n=1 Tax=Paenibacillus sp. MMS20-IR301 TaxID=2895946 RepID=UPI0028F10AD9|nr:glycosyl hydrolase 53 family protein [Paenibacillus sp. MMS20-IR301]WNS46321.1 glycosyl hydrolase 53 family protein [Paenibacillus sp. MMS20-IR301]